MRNRIDKLGVSEPEIRKQGSNQIVIQLAGVHDPAKAAELIGKTAQLEFYDLQADLTGPSAGTQGFVRYPIATASLYNLLAGQQAKAKEGTPTAYYLFGKNKKLIAGPDRHARERLFNAKHPTVPKGGKVFAVPEKTVVITCTPTPQNGCPGNTNVGTTYYYLFKYDPTNADESKRIPEMTGGELKSSGTQADFDQFGQPIVRLALHLQGRATTSSGSRATSTSAAGSGRRRSSSRSCSTATSSRSRRSTTPTRRSRTASAGGGQITNIGKFGEAKDLAIVLQTGALPLEFKQIERSDVSATLGKDSLRQAKIGGAHRPPRRRDLPAHLLPLPRRDRRDRPRDLRRLPLRRDPAPERHADAPRLRRPDPDDRRRRRRERRHLRTHQGRGAVREVHPRRRSRAGYQRGFHTILDANVVTAITALVLFAVATAQVKGFALMLLIGTALSLVTAVAATRAMLGLLAGFKLVRQPAVHGRDGPDDPRSWQQIDVNSPKRRRLFLSIATVAIVVSVVVLGVKGLNLGIDFKGGTQITFKTPKPTSLVDGARPDGGRSAAATRSSRAAAARRAARATRASRSGRSR